MKKWLFSQLATFLLFGTIYYIIEVLYRGYSDISMFILAGFLSIFIGGLNELFSYEMPLQLQAFISMIFATVAEGITGILLNVVLKLEIWDYSNLPGTFFCGQCNVFFCAAWLILSVVCIVLQDCLIYYVLKINDERPHYHFYNKVFWLPER